MAIVDAYGNPVEPGTPVITIYNANGLPVAPRKRIKLDSSIVATDDPASDSTALAAAAIAPATESTAGLMSAADKVKADSRDTVYSAAFTSVSSITSPAWAAGKYRRVEVRARVTAGDTTYVSLALAGITATDAYYTSCLGIAAAGSSPTAAGAAWKVDHASTGGHPTQTKFDTELATGAQRTMLAHAVGANGTGQIASGIALDATHDITGVVVGFSLACSGWVEVIGYV